MRIKEEMIANLDERQLPMWLDLLQIVPNKEQAFQVFMFIDDSVTWNTTCVNCSSLMDRLYELTEGPGSTGEAYARGYNDGYHEAHPNL